MPKWLSNWLGRHQHPVSLGLHVTGIPLVILAVVLAVIRLGTGLSGLLWQPAGLMVLGYLLQWIGHRIEGNDMGEVILIKKQLGRPYLAVSPRYPGQKRAPGADSEAHNGDRS